MENSNYTVQILENSAFHIVETIKVSSTKFFQLFNCGCLVSNCVWNFLFSVYRVLCRSVVGLYDILQFCFMAREYLVDLLWGYIDFVVLFCGYRKSFGSVVGLHDLFQFCFVVAEYRVDLLWGYMIFCSSFLRLQNIL